LVIKFKNTISHAINITHTSSKYKSSVKTLKQMNYPLLTIVRLRRIVELSRLWMGFRVRFEHW